MTIYIDADACPVTRIAEDVARKHGIPVMLLCDTNHVLTSDYSTVKVIGAGADAVGRYVRSFQGRMDEAQWNELRRLLSRWDMDSLLA